MIRVICYALFFSCWLAALAYDIFYIPSADGMWLFKLKFLTMINMVLQTFYYAVSLSRAVIDYSAESPNRGPHTAHPAAPTYYSYTKLHAFCDYFYTRLMFPVSFFVALMFWSLYAIDRELIFPEFLDEIIPTWVNHMMHTAPVPFILIDSLLICHKYPARFEGLRSVFGYGVLYQISIVLWYLGEGEWAYPILDYFDHVQRLLFFAGATVFLVFLYMVGDLFNCVIWGGAAHPQSSTAPKPKKKKA